MSSTTIGLIMGGVMMFFMAARIPVGITMFLTGAIGYGDADLFRFSERR